MNRKKSMNPRIIIHNAISIDGSTQGFTPDTALFYKLATRWKEDATLAGCDTLLNVPETIPDETEVNLIPFRTKLQDSRPILVVPDSRGRLRSWHYWREQPYWKDCIALCSAITPHEYLEYLSLRNIKYIIAGQDHVDYDSALKTLHSEYGIKVMRVESGGVLNSILLNLDLVDEISLLINPKIIGNNETKSFLRAVDRNFSVEHLNLKLIHMEKLRFDLMWLIYEVLR
jgi:2,5-diamino-6-(ribosylamino)-4(3H)-pyrimidinone 5'-phosphate reductase